MQTSCFWPPDSSLTLRSAHPVQPCCSSSAAAALAAEGYTQLKLKLSGDSDEDIARVAAVRQAVGSDARLTLDPNQSYGAKQMMRAFARMERHDIALIEQPVPAADWAGLALLTRTLPVDIEADESAQTLHDVQRLVAERVVDVINLKVTKLGGLRRFMQAVHVCEAGEVGCRMGAAFVAAGDDHLGLRRHRQDTLERSQALCRAVRIRRQAEIDDGERRMLDPEQLQCFGVGARQK